MAAPRSLPSSQNTPNRGRPSTPSQLLSPSPIKTPAARQVYPQTPRHGRSPLGASPRLPSHQIGPLMYSDGSPVKLFTPQEYAESRKAARSRVSSTTRLQGRRLFSDPSDSPTQRLVATAREAAGRSLSLGGCLPDSSPRPSPRSFVRSRSRSRAPSSSSTSPALVPAPVLNPVVILPGKRERNPSRPTVRLLSVINKCWDDNMEKDVAWTINDALLGGRLEERNYKNMWNRLSSAVLDVWPTLRDWIMAYVPDETDLSWFGHAEELKDHYFDWLIDPNLAQKQSSQERDGFSSTCYLLVRREICSKG